MKGRSKSGFFYKIEKIMLIPDLQSRTDHALFCVMKIIFMGTPDFALPPLNALVKAGHDILAVYSQPPRPAGRGKAPRPSPVEQRARALHIEVRTPESLKSAEVQKAFSALNADVAVVAAYGLILPANILAMPKMGCLNVHGSLLPRWRGAAPVQRAILAGDEETGVTIMRMERGLDTGPMLKIGKTPTADKNAAILSDEIAELGAKLMVEVLNAPSDYPPQPQPEEGITYAAKIEKAEALLDFSKGAVQAERQIRAFAPKPGAFFLYKEERIRILEAQISPQAGAIGKVLNDSLLIGCGTDSLQPVVVQRAGRNQMKLADMLRGFTIDVGTTLS